MLVAAAFTVVVGCGAGQSSAPRGPVVKLRNFAIDGPTTVRAGVLTFEVEGVGPTMHELNLAETSDSAHQLPQKADGTVDDQTDTATFHHVDEKEGVDIGDHTSMTVTLTPGHYAFYCNMDGHYSAGMSADLTVTA